MLNNYVNTMMVMVVVVFLGCGDGGSANSKNLFSQSRFDEFVYLDTAGPDGPVILLILSSESGNKLIVNTRTSGYLEELSIGSEWVQFQLDDSSVDLDRLNKELLQVGFNTHRVNTRTDYSDGGQVAIRARWGEENHCVVWDNQEDLVLNTINEYLREVVFNPVFESDISVLAVGQAEVFQLSNGAYCRSAP